MTSHRRLLATLQAISSNSEVCL